VREYGFETKATVTDPVVWFGGKVVPWDTTVYATVSHTLYSSLHVHLITSKVMNELLK